MKAALALAAAVLTACTAPAPPAPDSSIPPPPMLTCPGPVSVPAAPPAPRTVEAVARYATRLDEALVRTERNRRHCAGLLDKLQHD